MRRLLAHVWRAVAIVLAALTLPAMAQYADLDRADWREDAVPPPPAYSSSKLIDIEMPRSSSVRLRRATRPIPWSRLSSGVTVP